MNATMMALLLCVATSAWMAVQEAPAMGNAVRDHSVFTLPPGPNVEGVVLLRQGDWPDDVIEVFHQVPWIDAASIRIRWAELEPREQEFNWHPFDRLLAEVRKYNEAHPGANRTLHIRVMGGVHCPPWFEGAGVRFYDTAHRLGPGKGDAPLRIPMPYDNPEFLEQLRQVYRAMRERYEDEPLVTVYHGTWSAGPWDEIFHPQRDAALPPDYTPEKFVGGMVEQLDVLIDEFCLKGKVAELPYSGKYPQKEWIDITGPLTARIVERLGRRSPFLYIQSNGWGLTGVGTQTISWGHELDLNAAYGLVNLAFQALGTNAGQWWRPQGDWVELVRLAQTYDAAYVEIYPPDLMPMDVEHRIIEAFTETDGEDGFVGFRPWLKERCRTLYVRKGTVCRAFVCGDEARSIQRLITVSAAPPGTSVEFRARTRLRDGRWSPWQDATQVRQLPPGHQAQVEASLRTDDGYVTPIVKVMYPSCESPWEHPTWTPASPTLPATLMP